MTWWQALTILMQGVSAGAPMWVLLWAIDRLSAGGSTPEEAESLQEEWEQSYRGDAKPAVVAERPRISSTAFVGRAGWMKAGSDYFAVDQYELKVGPSEPDPFDLSGTGPRVSGSLGLPMLYGDEAGRLRRAFEMPVTLRLFRSDGGSFALMARLTGTFEASWPAMVIHVDFVGDGPVNMGLLGPTAGRAS